MANASYYFTLFKKFQSLGRVREGSTHGSPPGTENVLFLDPVALPGSIRTGGMTPLIGATTNESPLWRVLNIKANGGMPFMLDGKWWYPMPYGSGAAAAWADFGGMPLVNAFSDWIAAGRPMDYPAFLALPGGGTVPGDPDPGGCSPFVCSSATDDGTRPGSVPAEFWASSLVYLVDPSNGANAAPSTLVRGAEYYVAAVVGNRGNDWGGKYSGPTGPDVATTSLLQANAWAMAWGTGGSTPAVQLPSLSNNDVSASGGNYDIYFLGSKRYDHVGFRLAVQSVFEGLILAIDAAVASGTFSLPTGVSATDYITADPSHVCVKVGIRRDGQTFPANDASPLVEPRIAQRNLARFDVDNLPLTGLTNLIWKYFTVGAPLARMLRPLWSRDKTIGRNTLIFRSKPARKAGRIHLAIPRSTFYKWIGKEAVKGFEVIDKDRDKTLGVPFVDHVVLSQRDEKAAFRLPFMDDLSLGMAMGVELEPKTFKPGDVRRIDVEHRTILPLFGKGASRRSYKPAERPVGGFTLEFARSRVK